MGTREGLQLPELVLEGEGGGEGKVRARVTFFEVLGGASGALHVMRTSKPAALARRKSKVTLRSADAETSARPEPCSASSKTSAMLPPACVRGAGGA